VDWDKLSITKKRELLFREANYTCPCGEDRRRENGRSILEIDHIDGNPKNNLKDNLRVLCPTCHSLTSTYRNNGNKGNRKHSSRIRRGNVVFEDVRSCLEKKQSDLNDAIINSVLHAYFDCEIDFSKFGWSKKISEKLNFSPKATRHRIRTLLPEFYTHVCLVRPFILKSKRKLPL